MNCPHCTARDSRVVDSRPADDGSAIRRRRQCEECGTRFTTYERCERTLMVRKRSGGVEPFDGAKLSAGIGAALADRPASAADISTLVARIESQARAGASVVDSEEIGLAVLDHLRALDEVAYLRFASVYKEFQGAEDFEREMAALDSAGEERDESGVDVLEGRGHPRPDVAEVTQ